MSAGQVHAVQAEGPPGADAQNAAGSAAIAAPSASGSPSKTKRSAALSPDSSNRTRRAMSVRRRRARAAGSKPGRPGNHARTSSGTLTTRGRSPCGGNQTATATCTDLAGNVATASFAQIDVDQTGPVLTASATSGGAPYTAGTWTNQPVVVSFSCTDADSGVASESPAGVTVAGDGAGQSAAATCTDKVGNTTTTTFGPIDVDRTPPTVTAAATTADGAAYTPGTWTTQAVTVAFSCSDAGSGVATVSPARTFAADASDASATGTCTDAAGNTATATLDHVDVDLTPPTIVAHASPAANAAGWNNGPVTVTFSCSDGQGSGVATCPAPVTLSGEGAGQSASGTATDAVGHSATATVDGIDIDTTAPTVAWGDHPASYLPTDTVTISCSASDALSGIAASTCADVSAPASSFGFGTTTLTATVTDAAGNTTTARTSFAVSVTFAGLCSLTRQYVTSRVAANVACGTLAVAARLAQRDRTRRAAAALVGAYVTEVRIDERLRLVSQANAALLIELAGSLT